MDTSSAPSRPSKRCVRAWLFAILIVALGLRLGAAWLARDAQLVMDEAMYVLRATSLLDGKGYVGSYQSWVRHPEAMAEMPMPASGMPLSEIPQYRGAYQPPGYPAFLAVVMAVTGRDVFWLKIVQAILSTATVWLIYVLGRAWFDEPRALIAAGIAAVYPNFIAFSHYLWSETFYIFLLLVAVVLVMRQANVPRIAAALLSGLVFGAAALTRSQTVLLVPIVIAWLLVHHRRRWRAALGRAAVVALGAAVVITPWIVRNTRLHGGFVGIDSSGAYNLWRGNFPGTFTRRATSPHYAWPFTAIPISPMVESNGVRFYEAVAQALHEPYPTDLQMARTGMDLAIRYIRDDPGGFARRAVYKMIDMWNPTSFLLRHFRLGAYGPVSPWVRQLVSWAAVLSYLAVMVLAVAGWALWWRDSRAWFILAVVLLTCAVHATAFGLTRFRLPLMPLFMLLAAHAIWHCRRRAAPIVETR